MEDKQQELERLNQELLKEDDIQEELLAEYLKEPATPAFDTPETIHTPKEPLVYRNFSNNYGQSLKEERVRRKKELQKKPFCAFIKPGPLLKTILLRSCIKSRKTGRVSMYPPSITILLRMPFVIY